jgi:hypothetical protein
MAIFSLHHSFIGRSAHPAGAAGGYVRYITRSEACRTILGERIPLDRAVYSWLEEQEKGDRKNARVIDRVVVALPAELSREQNITLLHDYAERMTQGRTRWMAAIHDGPGDADNPHAHIVFRDRDVETGRRVMMTTEPGSTERFRQGWEHEVNRALERAGLEVRVDRRSLAAQGIDREPQIHVGAAAMALAGREHEFRSAEKQVTRLINGIPTEITVDYPEIDQGRSRFEENEFRKQRNLVRAYEQLAMNGPERPEGHPAQRAADGSFRFDARYRQAMRSGELPPDNGDAINTAIRGHITEFHPDRSTERPARNEERPLAPIPLSYLEPRAEPFDDRELQLRRQQPSILKEEPGMGEVLKARDYLNALTFERGEPAPSGEELLNYLTWQSENRLPLPKGGDAKTRREPQNGSDPAERGPRRDMADALGGGGLAAIGRIADSVESLFDGRTAQQIEKDDTIMAVERKIEQITEQQQRQQEAETEQLRQAALRQWLEQRDRERHHDRGR